jgi:hypothetical protein
MSVLANWAKGNGAVGSLRTFTRSHEGQSALS